MIIVLGMHRSGTSAVTRAIGLLGAAMGDEKRMRKHWENLPLRKVNERLFAAGKGTWDAPPDAAWLSSRRARELVDQARETVADQFGSADLAVWKDPRTCVTVPFWLDVFDEPPVFLLIHRHPTEVADSLTARDKLGRGHGYAIWERYNADALRSVQGRPTVVLEYDALLTDPVGSLELLRTAFAGFGVRLPHDPAVTEHGLVAQRRHHLTDSADAADSETATVSQHELFALLRRMNGAHARLTLDRPVPEQHPLSLELLALARLNRLEKRARRKGRARGGAKGADGEAGAESAPQEGAQTRRRARTPR